MSARDRLSDEAIDVFLSAHPGWARAGHDGGDPQTPGPAGHDGGDPQTPGPAGAGHGALGRTFRFPDYPAGIAFAVRVGFAAEARNHHPDLHIGWARVQVLWSTHDAGGITALDAEMAEQTDTLAGPQAPAEP
jgi:4a-hydroxytetrahydrobiopterin dehydratase